MIKRIKSKKRIVLYLLSLLVLSVTIFVYRQILIVKASDNTWIQNDWRGGIYENNVTDSSGITTFLESEGIEYLSNKYLTGIQAEDWTLSGWLSRRKITFDNTLDNLLVDPEDLLDFPIVIRLTDGVNVDYSKTNNDGSDIRFIDPDGTELSYEIEQWNESGESLVWVKVPQIDIGAGDYIYMYYNNPEATDNQTPNDVWSQNYLMVHHFEESVGQHMDSTVNGKNSQEVAVLQQGADIGKIGPADEYDGSDDGVNFGDINEIDQPSNLVVSAWFNRDRDINSATNHSVENVIWAQSSNSSNDNLELGSDGGNIDIYVDASSGSDITSNFNAGIIDDTWYNLVFVFDSADAEEVKVYLDGALVYSNGGPANGFANTGTSPLSLGIARVNESSWGDFDGYIDEFRIMTSPVSAAWVAAGYQSETDGLLTYESEEPKFETPSTLISNIFDTTYPSDWGALTYTTTMSDIVTVKVRSSNSDQMIGVTDWEYCDVVNTSSDLSDNNCVTDEERYIQYMIEFNTTIETSLPEFSQISIGYSASDQIAPTDNASGVYLDNSASTGSWLNYKPTIIWDAGEDDLQGNGLEGYCISIEQVDINTAEPDGLNPAGEAGILAGFDDGVDSDACPYIVTNEYIDLDKIDGLNLVSNKKYYFSIKAVDYAGNIWGGVQSEYQNLEWFKYDDTAPENVTYISTPSTDFGNVNDMFFNWPITGSSRAIDNESDILGWQYAVNSSTVNDWRGTDLSAELGIEYIPADIETGLINLSSEIDGEDVIIGNNTIYFRAIDNAGNVSTYVTGGINYGGAAPEFPEEAVVTITPQTSTSNEYALSWPAATPQDGDQISSYYYMINTQPPSSLSTLEDNNTVYIPTTELGIEEDKLIGAVKGTNNVYVVAVDNNDNYSPTKAIHGTFNLNSTIPDPPQNVSIADLSIKGNKLWRAALTWEQPQYKGNGDLTYIIERSGNSSTWTEISRTSGLSYTDIVPESKTYYYRVATIDTSNESVLNPSYSTSVSILPQGRYEEPPELISDSVISGITTRYAKVSWVTDRVCDSKVQIGVNSGEYFQDEMYRSDMVTNHEIELTNLSPGTQYYYRIKWTDQDGNTGMSTESVFQTKPAPVVEDIVVDSVGLNYAIVKLTTSGATKARIVYGKTKTYGGSEEINTSTESSEYSIMLRDLDDGTDYHYKIVLTDEEGYEYESFEDHVFTTPPRPQVSNVEIQEKKGVPTPTIEVFWESNIATNSIVKYSHDGKSLDKVDMELVKGEHKMEIEGLDPDSAYQLTVEGVDAMGNRAVSEVYAFTTATDTRPPQVYGIKSEGDIQSSDVQSDRSRSAQLIISWETDEPSTSQVMYGEGASSDGYPYSTQTDAEMRYKHVIIVSNLSPSKVYHFKVVSKDTAGNVGESGSVTSITPKSTDTVVESVLGSLGRIFNFF